jgi:hypothetical protein
MQINGFDSYTLFLSLTKIFSYYFTFKHDFPVKYLLKNPEKYRVIYSLQEVGPAERSIINKGVRG